MLCVDLDSDNDGKDDRLDTDDDGDDIDTNDELSAGCNESGSSACSGTVGNADGQAPDNYLDLDSDNDGFTDKEEGPMTSMVRGMPTTWILTRMMTPFGTSTSAAVLMRAPRYDDN